MAGRDWPEDVVREILSMLPVKSLMRFRCVCKPWRDLIKSPSFITHHLNCASTRKTAIVKRSSLQHDHRNVISFVSPNTLSIDTDTDTDTDADTDMDIDINIDIDIDMLFPKQKYVELLGPCNGILCITNHSSIVMPCSKETNPSGIVLCNPSIREFKVVPVPLFTYPRGLKSSTRAVGFGFDPKTDDYKVVRIVELYEDDDNDNYRHDSYKVEVYNLSSNSWREIDAILPSLFIYFSWFATLFNGAIHWYADSNGLLASILSFHISNEVTQMIPLPVINPYEYPDGCCKSLIALNESSLALIVFNLKSRVDDHFDMWVMNEYGVKESWTRHLKIGPLSGINQPLAFSNNGSELLMETSSGQLVSCNLQDQNIKVFPVHGVPNTLSVVIYSESLVSISSENEIEESA